MFLVYPYGHVDGDDDGGGYIYGSSYGRSPGTNHDILNNAWRVRSDGGVGNTDVDYISYGRIQSPNTIRSDYACLVNSSGGISYFNGINIDYSYGVYPHKFKYHYREINSRLGYFWKERRE